MAYAHLNGTNVKKRFHTSHDTAHKNVKLYAFFFFFWLDDVKLYASVEYDKPFYNVSFV